MSLPSGFTETLTSIAASGRSGRGLSSLCRPEYWCDAAGALADLRRIAVISGFFVPAAGAPETDGPGGAAVLARAFLRQGREAEIWTDDLCAEAIRECARAVDFPAELVKTPRIDEILDTYRPDGLIFIERLGRASNGRYYNAAGLDITRWTPRLDELAAMSAARGIITVGVGDGGNETGMGVFYDKMSEMLPAYSNCLSVVKTDIALPVDVSNWGAYVLTAALSRRWGVWRGHDKGEETAMLEALRASGAVDGLSLRAGMSVDGFPLSAQESVSSDLLDLWRASGGSN